MSDLIRRSDAIDAVMNTEPLFFDFDTLEPYQKTKDVVKAINDLPSTQPEITRCKDCKHGIDYYHEGDCYCSNPKWGLKYFGGSWEFYCADAERRTDE